MITPARICWDRNARPPPPAPPPWAAASGDRTTATRAAVTARTSLRSIGAWWGTRRVIWLRRSRRGSARRGVSAWEEAIGSDRSRPDSHFAKVVTKSVEVWQQSDGVFDITVQPLVKAWGFGSKRVTKYPGKKTVGKLLKCVGTNKLSLNGNYLAKTNPCITVDVNG
ncbi:hypothetical protein EON81_25860, partial [bacterium]